MLYENPNPEALPPLSVESVAAAATSGRLFPDGERLLLTLRQELQALKQADATVASQSPEV